MPNPRANHIYPEENFIPLVSRHKNIKLQTYRYQTTDKPIGLVIILNGLCYHTNHSAHVAKYLADQGFTVVGFDYRGFGKSSGERGEVDSFQVLLDDSMDFIVQTDNMYPSIKKFIVGASLGGLLAYHLGLQNPKMFSGIVLLSAMIKPLVGSFLCSIASTISRLLPKMKCYVPVKGLATKNRLISE